MFISLPLIFAVAVIGGVLFVRRGGRTLADVTWQRDATPALVSVQPLERIAPVAVVRALGRAEARAWLSSPWFAVGLALCLLEIGLFGFVFAQEDAISWRNLFVLYPIMAFPLTGMAVVGAHFAVTRGHRDRSEEIFAACPAAEDLRTGAHLLSSWVPIVASAITFAALGVAVAFNSPKIYGFRRSSLGDIAAALLLPACGAALGVALARWARWSLVPLVSVVLLVPAIVMVGNLGAPHWSNLRQLSPWPRYPGHDLLFTQRHVWSHLAWLAGLGALMGLVALAHARRDRALAVVAVVVVGATVTAGVVTARPIDAASARRIASMVADPAASQGCATRAAVSVCVFDGDEAYRSQVVNAVAPVAAAIAAVRPVGAPITLRQRFDSSLLELGPEVIRALGRRGPGGRDDIYLGHDSAAAVYLRARLVVALAAVGLPAVNQEGNSPYVAAGQARGVIALWLGAQGLPAGQQQKFASFHFDNFGKPDDYELTAYDLGSAWPRTCEGGPAAVVWSKEDLAAARLLLQQPVARVTEQLAANWAVWSAPTATTVDMMAALGLRAIAPVERVISLPEGCDE